MKKLLTAARGGLFFARAAVVLAAIQGLGLGVWMAMTPTATAREMTPTEMLESKLPEGKSLATATKPELLSAVCGAVTKWRDAAARIVKTAVTAQKDWVNDIIATAIRCLPGEVDCDTIVAIAIAAVAADPDEAADIVEKIIGLYPDCRAVIERDFKGEPVPPAEGPESDFPPNVNPPPGSIIGGRGGGFTPEEKVTICDNGVNVQVPVSQVDFYLSTHPGSTRGACEPTPITNT